MRYRVKFCIFGDHVPRHDTGEIITDNLATIGAYLGGLSFGADVKTYHKTWEARQGTCFVDIEAL